MKRAFAISITCAALLSSPLSLANEGELLIWINADKGYNGLQTVGDQFAEDTGVIVKVATPDSVTEKFQQEAAIGKGPDIFIWPHDRYGEWAKSGLISPIEPGKDVLKALNDSFWDAVSYKGAVYGYPIAVEGPTQICNADIVKRPFESFAAIKAAAPALAEKGKKAIMWKYNDTYFTYGLLTSEGGFAFENKDGAYNPSITGVSNKGAIAGLSALSDLITSGVMPEGVDYDVMDSAFKAGDVACIINGPWAWNDYENAGIDFIVGPYPSVDGGTPAGFIGVLSAAVNASSPDKDLAIEFIESYLLQEDGLKEIDSDRPLGAVTHNKFMADLSAKNPNLADAFKVWETSEPMPNIPEMGAFWTNMGPAITAITQGRQGVDDALNAAAERILN